MLLDLSFPKVMGVLNYTPDSFYDGGRYLTEGDIAARFEKLISDGADIIDVGCYSSRPGAAVVTSEEEKSRLSAVLNVISKVKHQTILSVDTYRSEIARFAVQEYGVSLINDISAGLLDDKMLEVTGKLKVPYIMMHMKGTPQTMQQNPVYKDLMKEVISFFAVRIQAAREYQVDDIIIDPGFGFGKTIEQNYTLLRNLKAFGTLELPIMVGVSRKSMIYKKLNSTPDQALNGTTVLHTLALMNGANLLRVHDVREACEAIKLFEAYTGGERNSS